MAITVNEKETIDSFRNASEPEFLKSPNGEILGRFVPVTSKVSIPESGLTDEELFALANDRQAPRCGPEEVMRRLREIDQCSR